MLIRVVRAREEQLMSVLFGNYRERRSSGWFPEAYSSLCWLASTFEVDSTDFGSKKLGGQRVVDLNLR